MEDPNPWVEERQGMWINPSPFERGDLGVHAGGSKYYIDSEPQTTERPRSLGDTSSKQMGKKVSREDEAAMVGQRVRYGDFLHQRWSGGRGQLKQDGGAAALPRPLYQ